MGPMMGNDEPEHDAAPAKPANGKSNDEPATATTERPTAPAPTPGSRARPFHCRARVCPVPCQSELYLLSRAEWLFQEARVYQLYGLFKILEETRVCKVNPISHLSPVS